MSSGLMAVKRLEGYKMPDAGYKMQDTRCQMTGPGTSKMVFRFVAGMPPFKRCNRQFVVINF